MNGHTSYGMAVAASWTLQWEYWAILGLVLIIADMILGWNFFVVPIGFASLATAFLLGMTWDFGFINYNAWSHIVLLFAVSSLLCVGILRTFFHNKKETPKDINDY
ncbi:MAG: hypothetical protein GDA54_03080 [Alphaproteobacteria bacterium GM7ARS4]|nr:hypothetical protein [Alphaproteobacteria bacterium GM7ARS4]